MLHHLTVLNLFKASLLLPKLICIPTQERGNERLRRSVGTRNTLDSRPHRFLEGTCRRVGHTVHSRKGESYLRALVADDSSVARRLLIGVLQHESGFDEIVQAADGSEALEKAGEEKYDLILLDWNMPEMLGIDVLRKIRETDVSTPVIMVTSEVEKARVAEAFDAGATNYIVKPFTPEIVAKKIHETLNPRAITRPSGPSKRTALVVDDSGVLRKLLAGILRDRCGFLKVVEAADGKEALLEVHGGDFDLITLDWNMPEMSGIDALRKIRKVTSDTPVVMVTSEKEGARVVEALEAGANHYIIKPFEPEVVAKKIGQVFRERH